MCMPDQQRNLASLFAFSAFRILPLCRFVTSLRICGNMRNDSGYVIWRFDQSASFRIFDSAFYFPHSAIPYFTHNRIQYSTSSGDELKFIVVFVFKFLPSMSGPSVLKVGVCLRQWRPGTVASQAHAIIEDLRRFCMKISRQLLQIHS